MGLGKASETEPQGWLVTILSQRPFGLPVLFEETAWKCHLRIDTTVGLQIYLIVIPHAWFGLKLDYCFDEHMLHNREFPEVQELEFILYGF